MALKPHNWLKFILAGIAILYPIIIFLSFVVLDIPPYPISIIMIVFSIFYLVLNITNESRRKSIHTYVTPAVLFIIGSAGIILNIGIFSASPKALSSPPLSYLKSPPCLIPR